MALATRCPFCQTTFRVAIDQLKLRGGLVRCGSCREVFDGNDHLVSADITRQLISDAPAAPARQRVPTSGWPMLPDQAPSTAAKEIVPAEPPQTPPDLAAAFASIAAATHDAPWGIQPSPMPVVKETPLPPRAPTATPTVGPVPANIVPATFPTGPEDNSSSNLLTRSNPDPVRPVSTVVPEVLGIEIETGNAVAVAGKEIGTAVPEKDTHFIRANLATEGKEDDIRQPESDVEEKEYVDEPIEASEPENAEEPEEAGEPEDIEEPGELPAFVQRAEQRERRRRIGRIVMGAGVCIFGLVLALQAIYIWRNVIAAWLPPTQPLLTEACTVLHCTVGLPTNIDQLVLESSELQLVPPNQNVYTLSVLLRNRSYGAQAWPYLELTLNDTDEKPVMRRIFTPREYLDTAQRIARGLPGEGEQQINLTFELSQPAASGYRIYLFYP